MSEQTIHFFRGTRTEYRTAALMLEGVWFADDYLDESGTAIAWDPILEKRGMASTGEQTLIDLALGFWRGHGDVTVTDALQDLDDENFDRFLQALRIKRGRE